MHACWLPLILLASFEFTMPETPAGKCAGAFLNAYAAGEAEIRAFEAGYRSAAALKARSMDDRVAMLARLKADFGELRPLRATPVGDRNLAIVMHSSVKNAAYQATFEFESEPPHKLTGIVFEGPVDASEGAAPAQLSPEARSEAVTTLAELLESNYVFPDKGRAMAAALRKQMAAGAYDGLTSPGQAARQWTDELMAISNDKHLRLRATGAPPAAAAPHARSMIPQDASQSNYGFERVELLPGNIGYVKLNGFSGDPAGRRPAAAAMSFLADCDALVFDLRQNGGGSPDMIQFLQSYLFHERTHLNSFYDRDGKQVSETWTLNEIPGPRFRSNLPVYVLTSNYTFSGAEEFSYNLQCLKRGLIVGETTGGGAHPVERHELGEGIFVMIPFMRAENPITKTNWEGVGVKPDIACPADQALEKALEEARKAIGGQFGPNHE